MKIQNLTKRAVALTLAGAMVCGTALATAADGNQAADKSETVYVTMNSDGSADKATDSVWLHSDLGLSGYNDETSLADITMLKGTEQPEQSGDRLVFSTSDTDAWYQGTANADLPLTTTITWTLDGKQVKAEDITGKSGHLVMNIAFKNNTAKLQTIDGESRSVCTPFVTVVAATLDADVFKNVTSDNATVQSDSSRELVGAVCLPGVAQTYDGLLTGNFAQLSDYLHDEVSIEADVTNFSLPTMYIAAATSARTLDETEELNQYGDVFADLDKLDDAMQQLIDGGKALVDGTGKVDDGTKALLDGITTLDSGAASLADGAAQVNSGAAAAASGAASAKAGAQQLTDGLGTLDGKSATLNAGVHQAVQQILTASTPDLQAGGFDTSGMTPDNCYDYLAAQIADLDTSNPTDAAVYSATEGKILAQVKAGVLQAQPGLSDPEATAAAQGIMNAAAAQLSRGATADYAAALAAAQADAATAAKVSAIHTQVTDAGAAAAAAVSGKTTQAEQIAVLLGIPGVQWACAAKAMADNNMDAAAFGALTAEQQAGLAGNALSALMQSAAAQTGLTDGTQTALAVLACQTYTNAPSSYTKVDDALAAAVAGYQYMTANAATAQQYAADSAGSDAALVNAVYKVNASAAIASVKDLQDLATGVTAYTAGVNSALNGASKLNAGLSDLASGLGTLSSGTASLSSGASSLKSGADQLKAGATTLYSGTTTLKGGAQELYDGLVKFNDEGISKLTSSEDIANLQTIMDVTDAEKAAREDYSSFAGIGDNTEGTVKFVMKLSEDKEAAAAAEATNTASTETTQESGNWFTNLWKRITALF